MVASKRNWTHKKVANPVGLAEEARLEPKNQKHTTQNRKGENMKKEKIFEDEMEAEKYIDQLNSWPSEIVARSSMREFTGGLYSSRYMATLDSAGCGCEKIIIGRRVVYPKARLIEWLKKRLLRSTNDCKGELDHSGRKLCGCHRSHSLEGGQNGETESD